jgi:hypothetical protein
MRTSIRFILTLALAFVFTLSSPPNLKAWDSGGPLTEIVKEMPTPPQNYNLPATANLQVKHLGVVYQINYLGSKPEITFTKLIDFSRKTYTTYNYNKNFGLVSNFSYITSYYITHAPVYTPYKHRTHQGIYTREPRPGQLA